MGMCCSRRHERAGARDTEWGREMGKKVAEAEARAKQERGRSALNLPILCTVEEHSSVPALITKWRITPSS